MSDELTQGSDAVIATMLTVITMLLMYFYHINTMTMTCYVFLHRM